MSVPSTLRVFCEGFQASAGKGDLSAHFYEAFHFDDNESSANELAELVLAGRKPGDGRDALELRSTRPTKTGKPEYGDGLERSLEIAAPARDELVGILTEIIHAARARLPEARPAEGLKAAEMLAKMCGWNEPE